MRIHDSISFTINGAFALLVVLLLLVSTIAYISVSSMRDSVGRMNEGLAGISSGYGTILEGSMGALASVSEGLDRLKDLENSFTETTVSTNQITGSLEEMEEIFTKQDENLQVISTSTNAIFEELKVTSGDLQIMIKESEAMNSRMLNSYIGFFKYLNEYIPDVEPIQKDIEAINEHIETISVVLIKMPNAQKETAIIKDIKNNMRRYGRYIKDLGEISAPIQIDELKPAIMEYGNKIMQGTKELNDLVWQRADARNNKAINEASRAAAVAAEASKAGKQSAITVRDSMNLAKISNSKVTELSLVLSETIKTINNKFAALPDTVKQTTESMGAVKETIGSLNITVQDAVNTVRSASRTRLVMIVMCLIAFGFSVFTALRINTGLIKPLLRLTEGLHKAASDDFSIKIDQGNSRGELKELIQKFNQLMERLNNILSNMQAASDNVAAGSVTLSANSLQMTRGVNEQAQRANDISISAAHMSKAIESAAESSMHIANTVEDTMENAQTGAQAVEKTVAEVHEIKNIMSESAKSMTSLNRRSQEIGGIVNTISGIALQTHMLSLNATIEAARAGKSGKGFAVVANEVRQLADHTSKATEEIIEVIKSIQEETDKTNELMEESMKKVDSGVDLSMQAGGALEQILNSINGFQTKIQSIASATEEISTSSKRINKDIETIANISNETAVSSGKVNNEAIALADLSNSLQEQAAHFNITKTTAELSIQAT